MIVAAGFDCLAYPETCIVWHARRFMILRPTDRVQEAMIYVLSTAAVLLVFWLVISGIYTSFLITAGVIFSVAVAVFCAKRLGVVDREGHPIHLSLNAVTYWPWLVWQIAVSAWTVSRIIINPRLPISPRLIRVKMTQKSDVGKVTYANSITLTPGTISVDLEGDEILVHALTRESAADLEAGEMDRRVSRFEKPTFMSADA
jgi:multicomponent Na+:H+ antiporter subunit E